MDLWRVALGEVNASHASMIESVRQALMLSGRTPLAQQQQPPPYGPGAPPEQQHHFLPTSPQPVAMTSELAAAPLAAAPLAAESLAAESLATAPPSSQSPMTGGGGEPAACQPTNAHTSIPEQIPPQASETGAPSALQQHQVLMAAAVGHGPLPHATGAADDEVFLDPSDPTAMLLGAQRSSGELVQLVSLLVGRLGSVGMSLHRMSREADHVSKALENAHFEVERVTDGANEKIRQLKRTNKEERSSLIRAALASLQQLRSHMAFTLGGLRLSEPMENQMAHEGFAFRQKRSRWGVVSHTGETMVVRLDTPLEQLHAVMSGLSSSGGANAKTGPPLPPAPPMGLIGGPAESGPMPPRSARPAVATPRTPLFGTRPLSAHMALGAPNSLAGAAAHPEPPYTAPTRVGALSFGLGYTSRPTSAAPSLSPASSIGAARGYFDDGSVTRQQQGEYRTDKPAPRVVARAGPRSTRKAQVDPAWLAATVSQTKKQQEHVDAPGKPASEAESAEDRRLLAPLGMDLDFEQPLAPGGGQMTPTMKRIRMERAAAGQRLAVPVDAAPRSFVANVGGLGAPTSR